MNYGYVYEPVSVLDKRIDLPNHKSVLEKSLDLPSHVSVLEKNLDLPCGLMVHCLD